MNLKLFVITYLFLHHFSHKILWPWVTKLWFLDANNLHVIRVILYVWNLYFKHQETRVKHRVMCASLWFFSGFLFSISESQKCKHSLSRCLWCSVPHKASINMTAKAVMSSEGSTEGGFACRLTSIIIDWVPCLVGPSMGQFTTWQPTSLWAAMRAREGAQDGNHSVFVT